MAGRDRYMLGEYKQAGEAFERALAMQHSNSGYALWLGGSYERRVRAQSHKVLKEASGT